MNAILPGAVLDFNNANPDKAAGFGVRKWKNMENMDFYNHYNHFSSCPLMVKR